MKMKLIYSLGAVLVLGSTANAQLTFNFQADAGQSIPTNVAQAFQDAGDRWSAIFNDNVTININMGWTNLGAGILGAAGSSGVAGSYSTIRNSMINDVTSVDDATATANLPTTSLSFYTNRNANNGNSATPYLDNNGSTNNTTARMNRAAAKALGLVSGTSTVVDATIYFSSAFSWDFDPTNGITAGQFDLVGVATHEIGHALGFTSGVDSLDTHSNTSQGEDSFLLSTLDFFRFSDQTGSAARDFTANNNAKYFSIDNGATAGPLFSNGQVFGDGRQASHWKDNLGIGIMDPTAAPGELGVISGNDIMALDVIGWDRVDAVPEPTTMAILGAGALALLRKRRKNNA